MKAAIKPRFNPEVPVAQWPFRPSEKDNGHLVLSTVGGIDFARCRGDAQCRCRVCKEPLI